MGFQRSCAVVRVAEYILCCSMHNKDFVMIILFNKVNCKMLFSNYI